MLMISKSVGTDHSTFICCGMFQRPKIEEYGFFKDIREIPFIKVWGRKP